MLLALRPWFWADTVTVIVAVVMAWLLVIFTRCRSYGAAGAAVGLTIGLLLATSDNFDPAPYHDYSGRMSFIGLLSIVGALIGRLSSRMIDRRRVTRITLSSDTSWTIVRWAVAWIVAGLLVGWTGSICFIKAPSAELRATAISGMLGLALAMAVYPLCRRWPIISIVVESVLCTCLAGGIGGVSMLVFDKLTWPMFADAFQLSDEQWENVLRRLIAWGFVIGVLLGGVAVAARLHKRRLTTGSSGETK